jgi:hypothetical protein
MSLVTMTSDLAYGAGVNKNKPKGNVKSTVVLRKIIKKPLKISNYKAQWTKLKYKTNEDDQPFIIRKIGDNWGPGGLGSIDAGIVRGGVVTAASRTVSDVITIGKFIKSPKGLVFGVKQLGLQLLNARPETRLWNPLSLGSIAPMVHIDRILTTPGLTSYTALGRPVGKGTYSSVIADSLNDIEWNADDTKAPVSILTKSADLLARIKDNKLNEENLVKAHNDFRTTIAHKSYMVPGYNSKMGVDAVILEAFENGPRSLPHEVKDQTIKNYSTLSYGRLHGTAKYGDELLSPSELNGGGLTSSTPNDIQSVRKKASNVVYKIGDQGKGVQGILVDKELGTINKGTSDKYNNELTDKLNMHPYGGIYGDITVNDNNDDMIPFKIRDIVNGKWIIFRALISGISDSVTADWSDERYVGRPDKVYVYQGVNRSLSFSFDVYPKTKQELPILWEKLNYLVGLCYPSYSNLGGTESVRMISPFINLTIGDMFVNTPGFLNSISISIEDGTTWEMDKGLMLPKYIKASCEFTYIGNYQPSSIGKHYDLNWLSDTESNGNGTFAKNPSTDHTQTKPYRTKYKNMFNEIQG